jgi:hypothetical protein
MHFPRDRSDAVVHGKGYWNHKEFSIGFAVSNALSADSTIMECFDQTCVKVAGAKRQERSKEGKSVCEVTGWKSREFPKHGRATRL